MTEFLDGTLITMEVMGCQVYAIRKAIRPLFTDPVTYTVCTIVVVMHTISIYRKQLLSGVHTVSTAPAFILVNTFQYAQYKSCLLL